MDELFFCSVSAPAWPVLDELFFCSVSAPAWPVLDELYLVSLVEDLGIDLRTALVLIGA
jgi:hypothetical protein